MRWYTLDKLPPLDEEGLGDSVPVLATLDGKTVATLAIYDHSIKKWFAMAGGEHRIMDAPLKWAYPEVEEHHHCRICSKSYLTQAEATRCFLEHDENTILRYVAYEIFAAKHFAKGKSEPDVIDHEIWQLIEQLNEKFDFAEVDEHGGVWNKSIRGKKL